MCCSCAMMSPSVTLFEEEEGVDVNGADRDGAEREGRAAEFYCYDLNWASLCLTAAASMAYMTEKWSAEIILSLDTVLR